MPELPEVETIRRGLSKKIIGQRIVSVEILDKPASAELRRGKEVILKVLKNNFFKNIERRGKLLIFELGKNGEFLLIHLKMTGQLIYINKIMAHGLRHASEHTDLTDLHGLADIVAGGHDLPEKLELPNKTTRAVFSFSGDSKLFFNDMRKFGYLKLVNEKEKEKIVDQYGIEPLGKDFTVPYLQEILKNKKAPIKSVLMDQGLIAGIGNIYADEVCFYAKIKPSRSANTLKYKEIKDISEGTVKILTQAIKEGGTTFRDYRNAHGKQGGFKNFLKVYGRAGEKCFRCKGILQKTKIGGRGTVFCPSCQK